VQKFLFFPKMIAQYLYQQSIAAQLLKVYRRFWCAIFLFLLPFCLAKGQILQSFNTCPPGMWCQARALAASHQKLYMAGFEFHPTGLQYATLVCTDLQFNSIWKTTLTDTLNGNGNAQGICVLPSGNIAVCGQLTDSLGNTDAWVRIVDSTGQLVLSINESGANQQSFKNIVATPWGFACNGFRTAANSNDAWLVAYNTAGTMLWQDTTAQPDNDVGQGLDVAPDGSLWQVADAKQAGHADYDQMLRQLSPNGQELSRQFFGDSLTNGSQALVVAPNGSLAICGETYVPGGIAFNGSLLRLSSTGMLEQNHTYGTLPHTDAAFCLAPARQNGIVMGGYSNSHNGGQPIDFWLTYVDSAGNLIDETFAGTSGIDLLYGVVAFDSFFVFAGTANAGAASQYAFVKWKPLRLSIANPTTKNPLAWRPIEGGMLITLPNDGAYQWELIDATGRNVLSGSSYQSMFLLPNQPAGVYCVQITQKGKCVVQKLIFQGRN